MTPVSRFEQVRNRPRNEKGGQSEGEWLRINRGLARTDPGRTVMATIAPPSWQRGETQIRGTHLDRHHVLDSSEFRGQRLCHNSAERLDGVPTKSSTLAIP